MAILNEAAARRLWPAENPLGRSAVVGGRDSTVVGVVSNVRETNVEDSSGPEVYLPVTQAGPVGAELVVRSSLPPAALATGVMRTLRELNPGQPATEFRPIRVIVDHAISPRRFFVLLVGSFATLGLILAALGIYGVVSFSVTQRTREIGIRMALGASAAGVQLSVLQRTLQLALAGIALGTATSLAVTRIIASLLFATEPRDPATFAGMILLLVALVVVAGYVPARRASHMDPMIALRND